MSAAMATVNASLKLPWESSEQEDRLFRRIQAGFIVAFLVAALIVPMISLPVMEEDAVESPPAHLARVLIEKKELPQPEPEPVVPPPEPPTPPPEKARPPEPVAEPVKAANQVELARESARAAGVLAFQDELSAMRDSVDVNALDQTQSSRGETAAAKTERRLITATTADSGGIANAEISRNTGGPALSARESTRVESNITAGTGRREASNVSEQRGGRSDASIRRTMDRNKGVIFSVYNRALRRDPLLEGKLVFEMVIEPSGEISALALISSELADEALTNKILSRIRMIRFDAANVSATRVNYALDFLPYG